MAKYAKIRTSWVVSDNSDYSGAQTVEVEDTETPDEVVDTTFDALVAGTTIAFGCTPTYVILTNNDPANFVEMSFDTNGSAGVVMAVLAGNTVVLRDLDPGTSLVVTADTATCSCRLVYWGT
jgi:hypothetical protein